MRFVYALALASIALSVACQEATHPIAGRSSPQASPVGPGVGSLATEAVILGPGVGSDTLSVDPLAGALVQVYKKEVTLVRCDSTGTTAPTCGEQTYTVPGAVDVPVPGGTLRGVLVASGTTGGDGRFVASGLDAWIYFVIVQGPAGGGYRSGVELHIPVTDGQQASARVFLPKS